MHVAAIIPVGPGHQLISREAVDSVIRAAKGLPIEVDPIVVGDEKGHLGRSAARNLGAEMSGADWYFWLDADDLALPDCFRIFLREVEANPEIDAMWGSMYREIVLVDQRGNRQHRMVSEPSGQIRSGSPQQIRSIAHWLNVGHFIRADLHTAVGGWCERLDLAEDFEYFSACLAHAKSPLKIVEPLAHIRAHVKSAVGPRGYEMSVYNDAIYETAHARGEAIKAYWRARGDKPWNKKERRNRPAIYGDIGPLLEGEG